MMQLIRQELSNASERRRCQRWTRTILRPTGRVLLFFLLHGTFGAYVSAQIIGPPMLAAPENGATDLQTTVLLRWNAAIGATSYEVHVAQSAEFSETIVQSSGITDTSYQLTGLAHGSRYFWRVRAESLVLVSDWSETWSFTTAPVPPPAPQLAEPADGATGQPTTLTVSWNPSSGATSYHLQLSASSTFSTTVVDDSTVTTTTLSLSSLQNETTYYWRVSAKNAGGTSGYSDTWSFTTVAVPPAVPLLTSPTDGSTNQSTSPTLSWSESAGAQTYHLQVSSNASFSTTIIDDAALATTSQQVGSLQNETTYFWRVNASNSAGTSDWSSVWSFTTAVAPPATPTLSSPIDGASNQSTS
ncbi:MAG: fibronectin type III domain-containing protein, partial [Bacteroidota bacterium]